MFYQVLHTTETFGVFYKSMDENQETLKSIQNQKPNQR